MFGPSGPSFFLSFPIVIKLGPVWRARKCHFSGFCGTFVTNEILQYYTFLIMAQLIGLLQDFSPHYNSQNGSYYLLNGSVPDRALLFSFISVWCYKRRWGLDRDAVESPLFCRYPHAESSATFRVCHSIYGWLERKMAMQDDKGVG